MSRDARIEDEAPFLVRIAGLPLGTMDRLSSDVCAAELRRGMELEEALCAARAALIEPLHGAVKQAVPLPRPVSRLLLAVKRDCFNERSLQKHGRAPEWAALRELIGPALDQALELEEQLARWHAAFEASYQRELERENQELSALLSDRAFLRGVTLSSPGLVERLGRPDRGHSRKREARISASLLRYASRAARKTSPFSTLTRLALGAVTGEGEHGHVQLLGRAWEERALLRFKRYVLDQDYAMLLRYPPFRQRLRVALNSSLEETTADRFCFLRAGYWDVDPAAPQLRYTLPSLVQVKLSGPLIAWLRRELPRRALTYAELLDALGQELAAAGDAAAVQGTLEKLLQIGFLLLLPPWPSNEGHFEKRLLDHLRSLPADAPLEASIRALDRLVRLQEEYVTAPSPLETLREIERTLGDLWEANRALGGLDPALRRREIKAVSLYEDVLLSPASGERGRFQEIARLSRPAAQRIERSARPLAQLAHLYDARHDFHHALAAFAARKWPGRREVGALELFREAQALWQAYTGYLVNFRKSNQRNLWVSSTFDPMSLAPVEALRRVREQVWAEVERQVKHADGESHIASADLAHALRDVPERYAPALGACLLLQPADAEGRRWVLNRLYEGTGRYASRYTPVMPEGLRDRYAAHFADRAAFTSRGERVELLDLIFTYGETLNVHAIQTPKALELPDELLELPDDRKLYLRDLRVRFGEEGEHPQLVDGAGRPYAAVHLGVAGHTFMPPLIKFLSLFGPGELKSVPLPRQSQDRGEITVRNRMIVDNLVLYRRRWSVPLAALPPRLFELPEADAYAALQRFRLANEIPERVFVIEHIDAPGRDDLYKPQYIDFTSPSFFRLFLSIARADSGPIVLEEVLPGREALPADEDGQRWTVELQLDSLALRPASPARAAELGPPDRACAPETADARRGSQGAVMAPARA